jgi:hypothetical protein
MQCYLLSLQIDKHSSTTITMTGSSTALMRTYHAWTVQAAAQSRQHIGMQSFTQIQHVQPTVLYMPITS